MDKKRRFRIVCIGSLECTIFVGRPESRGNFEMYRKKGDITWKLHTFMNFHISVNLIFVSAPLLECRAVPGPIFWVVEAGLGNHLHIKVGVSSCSHIAMTVIQNQTCKKRAQKKI